MLSGDHLKSASDLGIPLVAIGLLYKNGYFYQKINAQGWQESEYHNIELSNLPIIPVKTKTGEDLIISIKDSKKNVYVKVWKVLVGRVTLYLLDTDIEENTEENKNTTLSLYGGDQEMRIKQEMVLRYWRSYTFKKIRTKSNCISYERRTFFFLSFRINKKNNGR